MKKVKSVLALILALAISISGLYGCEKKDPQSTQNQTSSTKSQTDKKTTVSIKDLTGETTEVPSPDNLKSIAITSWKGAFNSAILLNQADKIKVMCSTQQFPWLNHVYPNLKDIPDYGSFDKVNVEQLLKSNVDVVISPSSASEANKKMRSVGLKVLVDGKNIENPKDVFEQTYAEINLVAELTGNKKIADDYYKWADETYNLVKKRVSNIPDNERVNVLPIRKDITQVFGDNCIWGHVIEMAGGKSPSAESTVNTGKFFADVDAEQIVKWNPQMMFQINFDGKLDDKTSEKFNNWANDSRFKEVTALKNKDVYLVPTGIDYWDASVEWPLCVLWMSKVMYPDKYKDIDVVEYANKFYKKFLNYDMKDADWAIVAQQYKGANPNGLYPTKK